MIPLAVVAAFALGQAADLFTGLLLPPGAEHNPLVTILGLPVAFAAKVGIVAATVWLTAQIDRRLGMAILTFGAVLGIVGMTTNVLVILAP